MTAQDRARWDSIYKGQADRPYPAPDPLLFTYTPPVSPGEERFALDLAGGLGQNGLWLAGQGYITDIMDISRVALTRARGEMAMRNLRGVNLIQVDVDELTLREAYYDVICVFRYLRRDLFAPLRAAVRPGGRIIYETFNMAYLSIVPGFNVEFLLRGDELGAAFAGWSVLLNDTATHITRFVAVKPEQDTPSAPPPAPETPFDW